MEYRCVAASIQGFVQQVASCYLPHGYWFYVRGCVPESKNPRQVDRKLIEKYGIGMSRSSRTRRKAVGIANLHYIRYHRDFLLLATHGHHPFFDDEGPNIRDARRVPIQFRGYSISVKQGGFLRKTSPAALPKHDDRWHAHVRINQDRCQLLKTCSLEAAKRMSAERFAAEFYRVPFEPYAPVRQQLLNIMRLVNQQRKASGLEAVPTSQAIRYQRKIVKPFEVLAHAEPLASEPGKPLPETVAVTDNDSNTFSTMTLPQFRGVTEAEPVPQPKPKLGEDFLKRFWPYVEKRE